MNNRIIASMIAKNQKELTASLKKVKGLTTWTQLDVMDGKFVPNRSLIFDFKLPTDFKYEAHLMVKNPLAWIQKHGEKVQTILVHIETCENPLAVIAFVRAMEKKVGLVINPETPVSTLYPYLDLIDQITVMTVHPGRYGAAFLPQTLRKIRALRKRFSKPIEVDGGIHPGTIEQVKAAGANYFISGSFLVKADTPKERMKELKKALRNAK